MIAHSLNNRKRLSAKAVLFDMDGVIFNSMPNHAVSWHEAMAEFGLDMPPEEAYRCEGMRGVETIKQLALRQWHRELTDEEARQMYAVKSARFARCPAPRLMRGIVPLMRQIRRQGLTIGIVTGSGQRTLLNQLTKRFQGLVSGQHIVTGFDVSRGKPAPDPYLRGMEKCGVEPWQTIVVENAPLGVRAAVAAGCFTVAVNTGPLPDSSLQAEGADLVLSSISVLNRQWGSLFPVQDGDAAPGDSLPTLRDDHWEAHFHELCTYIFSKQRLPSKHRIEDHRLLNWIKYNRKLIASGRLSEKHRVMFTELMEAAAKYRRINQYAYQQAADTGEPTLF